MSSKRTWSAYENQSDEAPFALFGAPLLSSQHDRGVFVPLHLQEARDEKGRRQFHGAFTGGWSAGYFNTVGSKEGWTPSTFVSSRANRAKVGDTASAGQRPEDFMDSEDVADAQELRHLQPTDDFLGLLNESPLIGAMGLGLEVVETAGSRLLRRMGWKPGQGIGPKVMRAARLGFDPILGPEVCTGAQEFLFAPPDVNPITVSRKSDLHGLGYDQNDDSPPHTTLFSVEDSSNFRKTRLHMDIDKAKPPKASEDRLPPLTGVSLGEDSDDDLGPRINYGKGKASKDSKKLNKKTATSSKSAAKRNPNLLIQDASLRQTPPGFVLPLRGLNHIIITGFREFDPPAVPDGWILKTKETSKTSAKDSHISNATSLQTPHRRGNALGEQQLPSQSIFDFISPEARARLALVSGKTNLPVAGGKSVPLSSTGVSNIEDIYTQSPSIDRESALAALTRASALGGPYHNDEAKLSRYITYLKFQAKQTGIPELPPGYSLAELKIELAEFYNCARIFKPMTGFMATRFAPSSSGSTAADNGPATTTTATKSSDAAVEAAKIGMYGNLTRSTLSFAPSRILYKRFNLPIPTHFQKDDNTEGEDGPKAFPQSDVDAMPPPPRHAEQGANDNTGQVVPVLDRPSDDVFRSIFGDDDD